MLTTVIAHQNLSHVYPVSLRLTATDHETVEQLYNLLKSNGVVTTKSEFLRLALSELATKYSEVK